MSSFIPILALVICWSILPSLKVYQVQSNLNQVSLLFVQQFLCIIFGLLVLFFTNSQSELKKLPQENKSWWLISIAIAGITTLAAWLFIVLTQKENVWFLIYAKPLSLFLTFFIAAILQKKKLTLSKWCGIFLITIGMWFFC